MTLLNGLLSGARPGLFKAFGPQPRTDQPGPQTWGGARLLSGSHRPLDRFRPVLALTIIDQHEPRPRILVGVRNPETNRTHQNVASVPTRRVPLRVAGTWLDGMWRGRRRTREQEEDIRHEVAHLFSLKLGLADAQERGQVSFDVLACRPYQGISVIGENPDGSPATEPLTMFNALVILHKGHDQVPAATASYRPLLWADTADFIAMTRSRDVGRLNAGIEDYFFCAYGLCLETSAQMLSAHEADVNRAVGS